MKVHGTGPTRPVTSTEAARTKGARPAGTPTPPRGERVQVSQQARALSAARGPEVPDTDKISRLKEAIRSGSFVVDADRIAEAMISEEL